MQAQCLRGNKKPSGLILQIEPSFVIATVTALLRTLKESFSVWVPDPLSLVEGANCHPGCLLPEPVRAARLPGLHLPFFPAPFSSALSLTTSWALRPGNLEFHSHILPVLFSSSIIASPGIHSTNIHTGNYHLSVGSPELFFLKIFQQLKLHSYYTFS